MVLTPGWRTFLKVTHVHTHVRYMSHFLSLQIGVSQRGVAMVTKRHRGGADGHHRHDVLQVQLHWYGSQCCVFLLGVVKLMLKIHSSEAVVLLTLSACELCYKFYNCSSP